MVWSSHSQACLLSFPKLDCSTYFVLQINLKSRKQKYIMHGIPNPFLENVAHQLFKTIGVIHVEKKMKKNEKCEALYIDKIRGTLKI